MNFDLDYEIDGILYCVSIEASGYDNFKIMNIEKYLPANNRRTKIVSEVEFDELEQRLIYDNTFIGIAIEKYLY